MTQPQKDDTVRKNQLLGALERATRERIKPHLRPVRLKLGAVSRPAESHRQALAEPDVTLARHPAPIVQPYPCNNRQ